MGDEARSRVGQGGGKLGLLPFVIEFLIDGLKLSLIVAFSVECLDDFLIADHFTDKAGQSPGNLLLGGKVLLGVLGHFIADKENHRGG